MLLYLRSVCPQYATLGGTDEKPETFYKYPIRLIQRCLVAISTQYNIPNVPETIHR